MFVLALIHLCSSASVLQKFGDYYLYPQSLAIFKLPDYFSGYSVSYSINCSPLSFDSNTSLISKSFIKYGNHLSIVLPNAKLQYFEMPSIWQNNKAYNFYFSSSQVVLLLTTQTSEVFYVVKWEKISSKLENLTLTAIDPISFFSQTLSIVAIGTGYKNNVLINQFFVVNFDTILDTYSNYIESYLPELELVGDLDISLNYHSTIFSVFTNTTVYILKLNSNCILELVQTIDSLYSIPGCLSCPLSARFSILYNSTNGNLQMAIVDSNHTLILYKYSMLAFVEMSSVYLGAYGEIFKVSLYNNYNINSNIIMLATSNGILMINTKNMQEKNFLYSNSSKLFVGMFSDSELVYILSSEPSNQNLYLSAININYPNSVLQEFQLDYDDIVATGPWTYIRNEYKKFIVRVDRNKVRAINPNFEVPRLEVSINGDTHHCNVTATDIYGSVNSTLTLIPLGYSVYNISLNYEGKIYSEPLKINYILTEKVSNQLLPVHMFAGWNLSCSIELQNNDSEIFTIEDLTLPKISLIQTLVAQDCTSLILGQYIVNLYTKYVQIMDFSGKNSTVYLISNATKACYSKNEEFELFGFLQPSKFSCSFTILVLNNEKHFIMTLPAMFNCKFINSVSNFLIISSPNNAIVYNISKTLENPTIISNLKFVEELFQVSTAIDPYLSNQPFLYLLYATYVRVWNLYLENSMPIYYTDKNIILSKYIATQSSNVFIVTENRVIIYDSLFIYKYREFLLNVDEIFILNDYFLGVDKQTVYLVNATENFLIQAVLFTQQTGGTPLGFSYDSSGKAVFGVKKNETIEIYSLYCPGSRCRKSLDIQVKLIDLEKISSNVNEEMALITCKNSNYALQKPINISVATYGLSIISEYESLEFKIFYADTQEYPVRNFFKGLDMYIDTYINSVMVQAEVFAPIEVTPPVYLNSTWNYSKGISPNNFLVSKSFESFLSLPESSQPNRELMLLSSCSDEEVYPIFLVIYERPKALYFKYSYKGECSSTVNIVKNYFSFYCHDLNGKLYAVYKFQVEQRVNIIKISLGNKNNFLITYQEYRENDSYTNNHIFVYEGKWNESGVFLNELPAMNFVSLKLDTFYSLASDANYLYNGEIEIFSVDIHFGLRIIEFDRALNKFIQKQNFKINKQVAGVGNCGRLIIVSCLDTTLMIYRKLNKKYIYSYSYYPYNNRTANYNSLYTPIICNNYFLPRYAILQISSAENFVFRLFDLQAEFSSFILRDLFISANKDYLNYAFGFDFIDSSIFYVADFVKKMVFFYKIQDPMIKVPSLSHQNYTKLKDTWGKYFNYSFNVSNGASFYITPTFRMDRGDFKNSGSSDDSNVSIMAIVIIIGVLFVLIASTAICVYRYIIKKKEKVVETIELSNYSQSSDFALN